MAREVLVGIVIAAKDGASATLKKVGEAGKSIGDRVDQGASKAKRGLEVFERSVNAVNSTMEIAKKGVEMLRAGFEATVGAALAQRAETDAQRQAFERFGVQVQRIQGLIGDVLLPVILGIADAFKPALTAAEKWLATSKQTMGSGLIEWLRDTAQILVSGVATGVVLVTQAWSGWKQLISSVKSLALEAFSGILGGIDSLLGGVSSAAKAFGKDELAGKIEETRASLRGMAADSQDSADQALADAAREAKAQEDLEKKIDGVVAAISNGIGTAATAAYARLGQETKKVPPDIDKITEASQKATERIRAMMAATGEAVASMARKRTEMYLREAAASERAALLQQAADDRVFDGAAGGLDKLRAAWARFNEQRSSNTKQANDEIESKLVASSAAVATQMQSTLEGYVGSVVGLFHNTIRSAIESGTSAVDVIKSLGSSILDMLIQSFEQFLVSKAIEAVVTSAIQSAQAVTAVTIQKAQVLGAAAVAGANAVASTAAIPIIGPALALPAGEAIRAAVLAEYMVFHQGGVIPGRPGEERMIIAKAGEVVVDEHRAGAAIAAGFGPMGSPGASARGSGSGGGHVGVTVRSLLPSTVEIERTERNKLSRSRARNMRLGAQGG